MRRFFASSLIVLLASGNFAYGQAAAPAAVPVPAAAPVTPTAVPAAAPVAAAPAANAPDAAGKYMLRDGTDVNLAFAQELSSKTSSEGDPVVLTLTDDLKVGDVVVAKAGAKAFWRGHEGGEVGDDGEGR